MLQKQDIMQLCIELPLSVSTSSMAPPNSVNILEICRVAPSPNSPDSATELSLPLTLFDLYLFKFPTVERLFFYSLTDSTFFDLVLPKLTQSLSHVLLRFLPFAGKIIWPSNSDKPIIHYAAGDTVSLTVAESHAKFDHLSGNHVREASESRPLVPNLMITDTNAPILAVQVTVFPKKGFCIGITTHHAVLDGKTSTMFMKAWAYICRLSHHPSLPPELTPFFDRTVIKCPTGLDMLYLNTWLATNGSKSDRSLQVFPSFVDATDMVRAIFELNVAEIEKLRKRALSIWNKVDEVDESVRLSAFVLTCAYVFVCQVKARGGKSNRTVRFIFSANYRARLDPPVPENYAGNCVGSYQVLAESKDLMEEEDGFVIVAKKMIGVMREMEKKGVLTGAEERLGKMEAEPPETQTVAVAGSNRFGVYGADFGWGRPKMVEVTSIDKTGGISMAESKDGSGGVEVGVVLPKEEMDVFSSLFVNGLKDVY